MSRVSNTALAAALAALLAGGAVAAVAQTPEEAIRQAKEDAREAQQQARQARMEARHAQQRAEHARDAAHRMVVQRLGGEGDRAEHLRNILQLRPNQEPALAAYLEALKPKQDRLIRFETRDDRKSTPERLDEMEKRIAEREAEGRARIEATRRFYAQLDERQKKAFDELPLMIGPGHFGPVRAMRVVRGGGPFEDFEFRHELLPPPPPEPPAPPLPPLPPAPPMPPAGV